MTIRIKALGQLRGALGKDSATLDLNDECAVAGALAQFAETQGDAVRHVLYDAAGRPHASVMLFLNEEQIRPGDPRALSDGDELTIMPPISGG